jgi:8-oxo-dGTP pyrophosphatase MutT (NUDIX family)
MGAKNMMTPRASAGGIVLSPEGKMLLVCQHNNSWSFPKGGIEPGESALEAARREIHEEAGITELTLLSELGSYERYSIAKDGVGEQKELGLRPRTLFLFSTHASPKPDNVETTDVRWVTPDEALLLLTHPKDKEFFASVRSKVEAAAIQ